MGVISFACKETGESFLGATGDARAGFNSNRVKLDAGSHPNKRLQELWNTYGEGGFEVSLLVQLEYEDQHADHTEELEELREGCLAADPKASKIWK